MRWYTEAQNTEAEYITKDWQLHSSYRLKTISTIQGHYALQNESKLTQLFNI